jgi:hypothetical protein
MERSGRGVSDDDASRTEPLNFRVRPETRKRFKQMAFDGDMKGVELLERMIEVYQQQPK